VSCPDSGSFFKARELFRLLQGYFETVPDTEKQIMGSRVELLAPAGNPDAFYGAVNAGADAVYLGSKRFGARAYADNFTIEEILDCIRYGHLSGRRLYLTVNTLMKEAELSELRDHIRPLYESGLDGVIVQDFGALRLLREWFPGLKLHASTQMTLCSSNGAKLLKDMGACRIVPARELSLKEIKNIRQKVDIELETFIHGAMCYCYSGQCLFSSILGGRSGNRGRCAQPCRLPYSVRIDGKHGREQYYLSLKDMCAAGDLPALIGAGIDSFKIEGRMKKPEYTAGVTAVYRKYIDFFYELREKYGAAEAVERFHVEKEDERILSSLYIRSGIQNGYYFKRKGREMITLESPAYSGSDETLLSDIRRRYLDERRRFPLSFFAVFREGEPASLTVRPAQIYSADGVGAVVSDDASTTVSATVTGGLVERASKQPVTEENIRRQIGRLGDTPYYAEEIAVDMGRGIFYPLKEINELRRQAVRQLEAMLLKKGSRNVTCAIPDVEKRDRTTYPYGADQKPEYISDGAVRTRGFAISLTSAEQLRGLTGWLRENPDREPACIYLSGDMILDQTGEAILSEDIGAETVNLSKRVPLLISLPYILREEEEPYLEKLYSLCGQDGPFSGFLIRSADGLGFLTGRPKSGLWHLDASVYTWNKAAAEQFGKKIDSFCLPYELKAAEQRQLTDSGLPFEKIVYGRIPMMITANCILNTAERCRRGSSAKTVLTDRYGKNFPVLRSCAHCTNIIYNCVPLSLHRELTRWEGRVRLRLDFTVEDKTETMAVLNTFLLGKDPGYAEYTTGHEKRGVI